MACRAESRILCGTGILDPTRMPWLGESARLIPMNRGVMVGESWVGPDVRQPASAFSALLATDSEEKRLLDAMLLAVPR